MYENEPELAEGLRDLNNVVIIPHIASATSWTRQGMATLAASNVAGLLMGYPVWNRPDILPFLDDTPPQAAPSILNAETLGLAMAAVNALPIPARKSCVRLKARGIPGPVFI